MIRMMTIAAALPLLLIAPMAGASDHSSDVCEGFGPQTPRDIAMTGGRNSVVFPMAPPSSEMNLCNIHFHNGAEHKAPAFSIAAPRTDKGAAGGFQCEMSKSLTGKERAPYAKNACDGVEPGDTVEFHWVHSSCDVEPGPTLGACLSESCNNPSLRVETQVFTVVNDDSAHNFADFAAIAQKGNFVQPARLPTGTGTPVEFLGSTTGPSFNQATCSPFQVTWSVRPECAKVSISSLSKWCESNVFKEDHAHDVRELVTHPSLLAPIR